MNRQTLLPLLMGLSLAAGCTSTVRYALLGTRAYPTTEGEATLEPHEGGGYDLTLEVDNLPTPERLGPGLTTYVLWLTPDGSETPIRAAIVDVVPTTRTGRATAFTATASFKLRVTAEPDANVDSPSETVVVDAVLQAAE